MEEEREEAEKLFDNLFHLRTFTSGRTLYMGGTEVVEKYPLSNYNCAFTNIEKFSDLVDVFYLLMVGSGVGIRITKELIDKLPRVRHVSLEGRYDGSVRANTPKEAMEDTRCILDKNDSSIAVILVGDSKEGWCDALESFFRLLSLDEYKNVTRVIID